MLSPPHEINKSKPLIEQIAIAIGENWYFLPYDVRSTRKMFLELKSVGRAPRSSFSIKRKLLLVINWRNRVRSLFQWVQADEDEQNGVWKLFLWIDTRNRGWWRWTRGWKAWTKRCDGRMDTREEKKFGLTLHGSTPVIGKYVYPYSPLWHEKIGGCLFEFLQKVSRRQM